MSRVTAVAMDVFPTGATPSAVSTPASAWGWSSWLQVIASASANLHAGAIVFGVWDVLATAVQLEVEIGTGALGVESGLHRARTFIPGGTTETQNSLFILPIPLGGITTGQRVSVRVRDSSPSAIAHRLGLALYAGLTDTDHLAGSDTPMRSAPDGANAVSITPNATAFAWSASAELLSGASNEITILGIAARQPVGTEDLEYELGRGVSDTPMTAIRTSGLQADTGGLRHFFLHAGLPVPASTRISGRLRKSGTSTTAHSVALLYLDNTVINTLTVSVSESTTVTESTTRALTNDIFKTVFESITVAESVTTRPGTILLTTFESVVLDDDASVPIGAAVSDRIFVRESVSLSPGGLAVHAFETLTVTEGPLNRNPEGVANSLGPEPSAPTGSTGLADYWVVGL